MQQKHRSLSIDTLFFVEERKTCHRQSCYHLPTSLLMRESSQRMVLRLTLLASGMSVSNPLALRSTGIYSTFWPIYCSYMDEEPGYECLLSNGFCLSLSACNSSLSADATSSPFGGSNISGFKKSTGSICGIKFLCYSNSYSLY